MISCPKCKKEVGKDRQYCPECFFNIGFFEHFGYEQPEDGDRAIFDANGQRRDRFWLNKKLDMTRNEKVWKEDMRSRRTLPDGSIGRFKNGKRVG